MGIGVIGVVGGAAASPFKTAGEVVSLSTGGFYRKITKNIPAGQYVVHFRGSNSDSEGTVGYLADDAGTRYPLINGENFVTLGQSTTSITFSKSFWQPPYFDVAFLSEYNNGEYRTNKYEGPAVNKYGNYITKREYSRVGGSNNHRYSILSSQNGVSWYRSANTTGYNYGAMYGGPYLNGKGGIWTRPDPTSRFYSSPDFSQYQLRNNVGLTESLGANKTMWDYADYSSGVDGWSGYFVLINDARLFTSGDGVADTFEFRTTLTDNPRSLHFANGKAFALCNSNGTFHEFTNDDGSRITRSVGVSVALLRIDHDGSNYCVSTDTGDVYYSPDLVNWTQATFPLNSHREGRSFVKWVPEDSEWVLATSYNAYSSTDGQNWVLSEDPSWRADSWYQMNPGGDAGLDQYVQFTDPRAPYTWMSQNKVGHSAQGYYSSYRWPGFSATMLEAI